MRETVAERSSAVPGQWTGHATTLCRSCKFDEYCRRDSSTPSYSHHPQVRRVPKGEPLYTEGEPLTALYAVRSGFFKTQLMSRSGRRNVLNFQMPGDMLGLDGISCARHVCEAVALEDSMVCVVGYAELMQLADCLPSLYRRLYNMLSHEFVRDQRNMLQFVRMSAQGRLVGFLIDLSERMRTRGYSASHLLLRMSREDIGDHLGLSYETVSRVFSRLQAAGLVKVDGREIRLNNAVDMLASVAS